jgi:hypothetical protein
MPTIKILSEKSASHDEFTVFGQIMQLHHSYLLMITDQEMYGLGTVSLAAPPTGINSRAISSPFNLFGMKNTLLANLLGKTVSKHLKKPVLGLILIKSNVKPKIIMETCSKVVALLLKEIKENNQQDL